eukprot:TRINITY_DN17552_c0_g1_i2.p1 TRINITY_DN17552_c0_g1~~TRINITY_DN17552_c0_g1_i2.p1  ORF type:complete len:128 (+),score=0.27 TRINITY_DN17552_c0_g1_i2:543-926(+)
MWLALEMNIVVTTYLFFSPLMSFPISPSYPSSYTLSGLARRVAQQPFSPFESTPSLTLAPLSTPLLPYHTYHLPIDPSSKTFAFPVSPWVSAFWLSSRRLPPPFPRHLSLAPPGTAGLAIGSSWQGS